MTTVERAREEATAKFLALFLITPLHSGKHFAEGFDAGYEAANRDLKERLEKVETLFQQVKEFSFGATATRPAFRVTLLNSGKWTAHQMKKRPRNFGEQSVYERIDYDTLDEALSQIGGTE